MQRAGLLAFTLTSVITLASANAADMYRAPEATGGGYKDEPVLGYSWTGFYGSAGVGWAKNDLSWKLTNPAPAGLPPFSASSTDAIFSGKVGYQYQYRWLVLGVEAGVSSLDNNNSFASGPVGGPGGCTANPGQLCQVRISDVVETVGGNLGVAWNDWLFYGEGGGAWSRVESRYFTPPSNTYDSISQNRSGWYAGGGIDHVFYRTPLVDVIGGVEYRHVDLGDHFERSPNGSVNSRFIGANEDSVSGKLTLKWNPSYEPMK